MVVGASTADLALLLVDASKDLTVQTKRHAFIASLLGIRRVVLAVNKMDAVDFREEAFERLCGAFRAFAARLGFADLHAIPLSALRGDNVVEASDRTPWYRGPTLLQHLLTVYVGGDRNFVDLRFPVQLVLRPHRDFRGYAGQVASGVLHRGDEVVVLPSGRTARVEGIRTFDGDLAHAFPPQSVVVTLDSDVDVARGDLLVRPGNRPPLRRATDAMIVWMSETPMRLRRPYLVKHLASTVRGVVQSLAYRVDPATLHREEAATLGLNEIGRAKIEFFRPLPCDAYDRNRATGAFIVIDPLTNETVAAGMVLDRAAARPGASPAAASAPVETRAEAEGRGRRLGQRPFTLWLTGLSGAGKTTLARAVERRLADAGRAAFVLDGDLVRQGLCRDLGFSPESRRENIRRIGEVARILNEAGLIVVTSLISPYREDREGARTIIGQERFLEVFVDAPLAVCETRDPKGLYVRARAGEIGEFTGVSAPYEPPEAPAVHVRTDQTTPEEAAERLVAALRERGAFL